MGDHTVGPPSENLSSHDFLSEGRREDLVHKLKGGSVEGAPLVAALRGAEAAGSTRAVPAQPRRSLPGPGQKRTETQPECSRLEKSMQDASFIQSVTLASGGRGTQEQLPQGVY